MNPKINYYLQIADNALILSHRLSEYSSHGPYLEEDLATTNVALDLIGIAESIYEEIARIENNNCCGDDIVYRRSENEFLNCLLVEQPNTDFAFIIVRQFLTDAFHFYLFSELTKSEDKFLSDLAFKSLKEITYHLRRSSEWMIRLGDGTEEANIKTQFALDSLWKYTREFFIHSEADNSMENSSEGADLVLIESNWNQKIKEILYMSHLNYPSNDYMITGGKSGKHTEHLGYILTEMQFLPSKYPDAKW